MTCSDIYFGNSISEAPPTPFWRNPAILPGTPTGSTPELMAGPVDIGVVLRNNGLAAAPLTKLELFWSDPTTGFDIADPVAQRIGPAVYFPWADDPGTGADESQPELGPRIMGVDGEVTHTFSGTLPPVLATTNGGHYCLLARARNEAAMPDSTCVPPQQVFGPKEGIATDALHAIRNIHVVAMTLRAPTTFGFQANNNRFDQDTVLDIRPMEVKAHRKQLEPLAMDPIVARSLAIRQAKFGVPAGVRVALGRERMMSAPGQKRGALTRFRRTGVLRPGEDKFLVAPGEKLVDAPRKGLDLKLLPGEKQQVLLEVQPCGGHNRAYAVNVEHRTRKDELIGGLTVIFISAHDPFC